MNQIVEIEQQPVAYKGAPVMTTNMLAKAYGTEANNIQMNFSRNSERFTEGTHFFKVTGADLKALKREPTMGGSVTGNVNALVLWTEKGAARHAKLLNTPEAWGVYGQLMTKAGFDQLSCCTDSARDRFSAPLDMVPIAGSSFSSRSAK